MGLTDEEIQLMREHREEWLPDVIDLRREAFLGDDKMRPGTLYTAVPCRIHNGFGFWSNIADRFATINAHTVTFKWDFDVQEGDKLVHGTGDDIEVFNVRDVRDHISHNTGKVVLADRISGGVVTT